MSPASEKGDLSNYSGIPRRGLFAAQSDCRALASSHGKLVVADRTIVARPGVVTGVSGPYSSRLTVDVSVNCVRFAQHETAACQLPCGLKHALLLDSNCVTAFV